jgi:hypothetical protein
MTSISTIGSHGLDSQFSVSRAQKRWKQPNRQTVVKPMRTAPICKQRTQTIFFEGHDSATQAT